MIQIQAIITKKFWLEDLIRGQTIKSSKLKYLLNTLFDIVDQLIIMDGFQR